MSDPEVSQPELSPEDVAKVKEAINVAAAATPTGAAPLFGLPIPDLSSIPSLGKLREALSTVVSATDTLLQYKWLIPDQYEGAIVSLNAALKKVLGWLPA